MTPKKKAGPLNGLAKVIQPFYMLFMIAVIVGGLVFAVAADRTVIAEAKREIPKIPLLEQRLEEEIEDRKEHDERMEEQLGKIDGKLDRLIDKLIP